MEDMEDMEDMEATDTAETQPAMSAAASHHSDDGSRAFGLGSHRRRRAVRAVAGAVVGVSLLTAVLLLAGPRGSHSAPSAHARRAGDTARSGASPSSTSSSSSSSTARYGGLPSWLPKPETPVNRVVTATAAHPALAIQGDTVSVDLAHGRRVLATAVGPETPEQGRFPVPATSPCTFVVTFAHASGAIGIGARAFAFIDERGHVRHSRVTAMGGGAPPRLLSPGRPVSLRVYDVLPTGDGGLTWTPEGGRPIVSWDFDVEID
jgi:hypothetical protein